MSTKSPIVFTTMVIRSNNRRVSEQQPKKRVIRRRRPSDPNDPAKERARKLRMYFSEETERSVIAYQETLDVVERNVIYRRDIAPAFEKMAENLINIHRFTDVTFEELKADCIAFLFETLPKWDKTRGTAAFSYFNVVGKNFLINRTKQRQQRTKRNVPIDDDAQMSTRELKVVENHSVLPAQDVVYEEKQAMGDLLDIFAEVREYVQTPNELTVINSIITIFENIDSVDFFTRTAAVIYIKELSGLSSKQLATAMQNIKKLYREIKDCDLELFG